MIAVFLKIFTIVFFCVPHNDCVLLPSTILWCAQSVSSYIRGVDDTINNWLSPERNYILSYPTKNISYMNIDINHKNQSLLWTQTKTNTIATQPFDQVFGSDTSAGKTILYLDSSTSLTDIASDWYSGNVYFLDAKNKFIGLATSRIGESFSWKIIWRQGVLNPVSIVLDPNSGLMFWLDLGGAKPSLYRGSLSGTMVTIINPKLANFVQPVGLEINRNEKRVYWLTNETPQRIASCDYNGQNDNVITLVRPLSKVTYTSFTVFDVFFLVAAKDSALFDIYYKNSSFYHEFAVDAAILDIKVYGSENVLNTHECSSLACQHICINLGKGKGQCSCSESFTLQPDGKSCSQDLATAFIMSTDSGVVMADAIIIAKNNSVKLTLSPLPVNLSKADAIGFNYNKDLIYVADVSSKNVLVGSPSANGTWSELTVNTGKVLGVVVDWSTNNVYWSDAERNQVTVVTEDGKFPYVVMKNVGNPLKMTIDASTGSLFWTNGSAVFSSDLAGNKVIVLASGEKGIEGISVDPATKSVIWAVNDPWIEIASYNGDNRQIYSLPSMKSLYGVTTYQDILVWGQANSTLQFLRMKDNATIDDVSFSPPAYNSPMNIYDVILFSNHLQPNINGRCTNNNNGCAQLCLPENTQNAVCACGVGFKLHSDGKACKSDLENKNFLLLVDPYHKQIYQLAVGGSSQVVLPQGVPLDRYDTPLSADWDSSDDTVYWINNINGQTVQIWRAKKDNTNRKMVFNGAQTLSPSKIAVDSLNKTIFFIDQAHGVLASITTDGSELKILVKDIEKPLSLALDPNNNIVYWTTASGSVWSCDYKGTNKKSLMTSLNTPMGLAVGANNTLYVGDKDKGLILSIKVDTLHTEILLSSTKWQIASLAFDNQSIYFSTWNQRAIYRISQFANSASEPQLFSSQEFARVLDIKYVGDLSPSPPPPPPPTPDLYIIIIAICVPCLLVLLAFLIILLCIYCRRHRKNRQERPYDEYDKSVHVQKSDVPFNNDIDHGFVNKGYMAGVVETPVNENFQTTGEPKPDYDPSESDNKIPEPDYNMEDPSLSTADPLYHQVNDSNGTPDYNPYANDNHFVDEGVHNLRLSQEPIYDMPKVRPSAINGAAKLNAADFTTTQRALKPPIVPVKPHMRDNHNSHNGLPHGKNLMNESVALRPVGNLPNKTAGQNSDLDQNVNDSYEYIPPAQQPKRQPTSLPIDYSVKPKPYRQSQGFAPASRYTPSGHLVQTFGRHQKKYLDKFEEQADDNGNEVL